MNDSSGILEHQVRTLQHALRHQQEQRCREIVADAEHRGEQAVRDSRRKLRERQRQAVREERQRREHELLLARSRIETRARRRAFRQHESVLQSAWPLLAGALEQRWSDAEQRLAWCEMIVAEAAATLENPDWVVEHPATFAAQDREALTRHLLERALARPTFVSCNDFSAGLRIRAGQACLDGTIRGLLDQRYDVEALLLAAWERQDGDSDG